MRRNQTDIENLIAGLHRSDRKAINETILRYGRLVTSIAGSMLSDPRNTEELTQSSDNNGELTYAYFRSNDKTFIRDNGSLIFATCPDGAMLQVKSGNLEMAQTFHTKDEFPSTHDSISLDNKMTGIINELRKTYIMGKSRMVEYIAEPRNSGVIRLRDAYTNSDEVTQGMVWTISGKNNALPAWEDIQNKILSMVGENYDMSITYIRDRRLLTIQDYKMNTLIAACYKNGRCHIFIGSYLGKQPFLPSN